MPNSQSDTPLPEGTDSVIAGASAVESEGSSTPLRDRLSSASASLSEHTAELRGQAGDKARAFAEQGKERATSALETVSQFIGDAAAQVDEKIGKQYGDYARRAQDAVSGFATTLRDKDVDALFDDARAYVKKSPVVAITAAAVVGFALVRLLKSSTGPTETASSDTGPTKEG